MSTYQYNLQTFELVQTLARPFDELQDALEDVFDVYDAAGRCLDPQVLEKWQKVAYAREQLAKLITAIGREILMDAVVALKANRGAPRRNPRKRRNRGHLHLVVPENLSPRTAP